MIYFVKKNYVNLIKYVQDNSIRFKKALKLWMTDIQSACLNCNGFQNVKKDCILKTAMFTTVK